MHLSSIDWNNDSHRQEYEEALEKHRDIRKNWSLCKNSQWFFGYYFVSSFYGGELIHKIRQWDKYLSENMTDSKNSVLLLKFGHFMMVSIHKYLEIMLLPKQQLQKRISSPSHSHN